MAENDKILVVEDDRNLLDTLKYNLRKEGYDVVTAADGAEALDICRKEKPDLIILDIMLPKKNGVEICHDLRLKEVNTPILMLTAKDMVEDRVKGLDAGADDYLVKPFAFNELLARIRALLRRTGSSKSPKLQVGDLVMDTLTREVWRGQRIIELTSKEYTILEYFMRHPNVVITRTMLEEHAWDYEFDSMSNIIDVYIRKIRSKIDERDQDSLIQTVRGAGYRMKAA